MDFDFDNSLDLLIFPIIVSIFIITQGFVVIKYIVKEAFFTNIKKLEPIALLSVISTIVIASIIIFTVVQVLLDGVYYTNLIQFGIAISYIVSFIAFGLLVYRLLKWYKEDKEFIVLVYTVAIISILFRIVSVLLMESSLLQNADYTRNFDSIVFLADLEPDTLAFISWEWYSICSVVSIMLLWLTNAVFLRNYYKKFSRFKYFVLVILLPSFTMIDFIINQSFFESGDLDPIVFDIVVLVSGVLAGILLAVPYFIIARNIKEKNNNIRYHLIFVGFGLIIFVISGTAIIDHLPFPPFGFMSILSMQLAALVIYISLFKAAVSFSFDSVLRKSIDKEMYGMADMLKKIGNSEMNRKMLNNTIEAQQRIRDSMTESKDITPTMDNEKIREYIEIISAEIQQSKK